jgi:hypothetical protein
MLHHARLETPGPEPPLEPVPTEPSPTPTPEPTPDSIPHVPTPFPPTLDLGPPVEPTRPGRRLSSRATRAWPVHGAHSHMHRGTRGCRAAGYHSAAVARHPHLPAECGR